MNIDISNKILRANPDFIIITHAANEGVRKYVLNCTVEGLRKWAAAWLDESDRSVISAEKAFQMAVDFDELAAIQAIDSALEMATVEEKWNRSLNKVFNRNVTPRRKK